MSVLNSLGWIARLDNWTDLLLIKTLQWNPA